MTASSVTKCSLSPRHTRLRPLALLALLDQVIREASERDREEDEEDGRHREPRVVEVVGGVEARWAAASVSPSTVTSAVSFCRPMKSFRSGGMTRRIACGRTTNRSACV